MNKLKTKSFSCFLEDVGCINGGEERNVFEITNNTVKASILTDYFVIL